MQFSEITRAVADGEQCLLDVNRLRGRLRYKTAKGDPDRERDIEHALGKIDTAMKPLRSLIGRLLWDPQPDEQDYALRDVSKRLQYERKQLKKMRA